MRVRGMQHGAMRHAGQHDVADVAARPGQNPPLLTPPHRLPDPELGHVRRPFFCCRAGRYGGTRARAIGAMSRLTFSYLPASRLGRNSAICGKTVITSVNRIMITRYGSVTLAM